jgi:hypothetical protein
MKSFLLLFLGIVAACSALAQTGQPVQAPIIVKRIGRTDIATTTFQAAYDSASNGDAIYLPGGIFTPPQSFDRRLFIYGVGYSNDSSAAMITTNIAGNSTTDANIGNFFNLQSGSSGSVIVGVHFLSPIKLSSTTSAIDFQRCKIDSFTVSSSFGSAINFSESIVKAINPIGAYLCAGVNYNISNCIIEGLIDGATFIAPCGSYSNIMIRNSILLGTQTSSLRNFGNVKIDKSIIFLKTGAGTSFLQNVNSQNINDNLFIADNTSRVNLAPSALRNVIKGEIFRNNVLDSTSNYRNQPSCAECANKGVYSGTGNFRATAPVHITQREISIGSTNNRLRFKFTVKTSN